MLEQESVTPGAQNANRIHLLFSGNPAREQMRAVAKLPAGGMRSWKRGARSGERFPGRTASLSRAESTFTPSGPHDPFVAGRPTAEAGPDPERGSHQRWQQGYQLSELIREWGTPTPSVAAELERYAGGAALDPAATPAVRLAWAKLCADGVTWKPSTDASRANRPDTSTISRSRFPRVHADGAS